MRPHGRALGDAVPRGERAARGQHAEPFEMLQRTHRKHATTKGLLFDKQDSMFRRKRTGGDDSRSIEGFGDGLDRGTSFRTQVSDGYKADPSDIMRDGTASANFDRELSREYPIGRQISFVQAQDYFNKPEDSVAQPPEGAAPPVESSLSTPRRRQARQYTAAEDADDGEMGGRKSFGRRATLTRGMTMPLETDEHEDHEYNLKRATAKMLGGFMLREDGSVGLETGSVYGAAILLPQVARSGGWPRFLTALVIRSYVFLIVNLVIQGGLLYMIQKEEVVMDVFAGQMYLCDFGAMVSQCPGGETCRGPHGTQMSAPRMYGFSQWQTRVFVRDSIKALFPEKAAQIDSMIDPGEYGVESYTCRLLCCFIFMMSVMSELYLNIRMLKLIYYVPTADETWLELVEEDDDLDYLQSWLDAATIKVAGMTPFWKIINIIVVFLPKMLLWKITAEAGVTFLMETASIEDLIVNSVALTFVLNIDEMMFELMCEASKMMLTSCNDLSLFDEAIEQEMEEEEIIELYHKGQELKHFSLSDLMGTLPAKLLVAMILTFGFVFEYYLIHCDYQGHGRWFSKPMYQPTDTNIGLINAFFPSLYPWETTNEPFWTMPPAPTPHQDSG
eukprot:TRINITY_DN5620_c0_g1_i1.p1 TRINITY_DN5620_c0_g1~~TRINITY_DN5620_c0_g1_i1.p1  ORF type:complete len:616 (+),score=141.78 TRINITY_DN5620_c0_g1_i1:79-1926(+)